MHHDQVADKSVTSGSHDYEGSPSLGLANAQHAAKFKERHSDKDRSRPKNGTCMKLQCFLP